MAPPDVGISFNPIPTRGDRLCPPNSAGFLDLPTALQFITCSSGMPTKLKNKTNYLKFGENVR
jgi:hypothetical protein